MKKDFNPMKLNTDDKELLRSWYVREDDFSQIEKAMKVTRYILCGEGHDPAQSITREKAIQLLGRGQYLSGIARSAFHFSAARETPNGKTVLFDSSKLFK